MAIQLTAEQERRLQTVVDSGAYPSTEEALDATVSAIEEASVHGFDGTQEELDALLLEGLNSGEPILADNDFWRRFAASTDQMLADHRARR